jgi:hypothetical protein
MARRAETFTERASTGRYFREIGQTAKREKGDKTRMDRQAEGRQRRKLRTALGAAGMDRAALTELDLPALQTLAEQQGIQVEPQNRARGLEIQTSPRVNARVIPPEGINPSPRRGIART